jgi:tetratricopeptide (TPR) repeat protein
MPITVRSNLAKRSLLALETLGLFAAIMWVSGTYVADRFAQKLSVKDLQIAVKLDPWNSDHRLRLGRVFQYNIRDIDFEQAMKNFSVASELNPHDSHPWVELGAALQFQGRTDDAEACLRRADSLAPNIPSIQWAIGNFMLLHGDVGEAFRHFKMVLVGSTRYNTVIFSTAWKASGDADEILNKLIPNESPAELSYLYYLIAQQRFGEAGGVWDRIVNTWQSLLPRQAAGYIDSLIRAGRHKDAQQVWGDLIRRGAVKSTYQVTEENLIVNGDFEEDPLNMGFDWRMNRVEGVYTAVDGTTFHSPGHSLLVQFSGKANIYYRHTYQYVPVQPGRTYLLQGFIKTEDITTDSGPRLEVRDAYDPHLLRELSEGLTGSTLGWQMVSLEFTPGPKTDFVTVGLTRLPSRKLDNLVAGRLWIDDLSLKAATTQPHPTR